MIKKTLIARQIQRLQTANPVNYQSLIQIFELFQAFHRSKDAPSDLPYSIALLLPLVSIGKDEMNNLISMLSESIGQITAEDLLLINLSEKRVP